ncbi:hypothetical protein [Alkalihalophilus marmarensis]|jgi:hypothetical protein|nr:hypothetical protein [Alkalihalophilus marmarensis]
MSDKEDTKKVDSESEKEVDYKELMGVYRDIYKRGKGGAIKRK